MDEPDAGGSRGRAADHPLAAAKYVLLTTFRRTGAPVATPVWLAPSLDDPELFTVITVDDTGKTKRLAHTEPSRCERATSGDACPRGHRRSAARRRVVRDEAGRRRRAPCRRREVRLPGAASPTSRTRSARRWG